MKVPFRTGILVASTAPVSQTARAFSRTRPPQPQATTEQAGLSEEGAAEAAIRLFNEFTACLDQLPNCDAALVASRYEGASSDEVFIQISTLEEGGATAGNTESREISVESVMLDTEASSAVVTTCENDGSILFNSQGDVVNGEYGSLRRERTLVLRGSEWLGSALTTIETAEGEDNKLCEE